MSELAEQPQSRTLSPFSFFAEHSSALAGLGGPRQPPDPRYCFHTPYEEHRPGIVMFTVRLIAVRANFGELTVRVHAFRPDSNLEAALVAATQYTLENLNGGDVEIALRIAAVPGVQYAAYGFLSEPSDVEVYGLEISAEDLGGDQDDSFAAAELAETRFGGQPLARLNQLVGQQSPDFRKLLSQPFTASQLQSAAFSSTLSRLPDGIEGERERWRYAFALRALETYGFLETNARGLLIGGAMPMVPVLLASGIQVIQHGSGLAQEEAGNALALDRVDGPLADLPTSLVHCDFALAFGTLNDASSYSDMRDQFSYILKCLQRGGLGVFLFNYWPNSWGAPAKGPFIPTETCITRLALYVIGHGSAIAQLLLPSNQVSEIGGLRGIPYGLIVRR